MSANIINGFKFQLIEDASKIYRVTSVDDSKLTTDGIVYALTNPEDSDDNVYLTEEEINEQAIRIAPDAFINMMTVWLDDEGKDMDVYVCANKIGDMVNDSYVPSVILRQNVYSESKNGPYFSNSIYMGECYAAYNIDNMETNLQYKQIKEQCSVAFYIGDTQKDILKYTRRKFKKDAQTVLNAIKSKLDKETSGMAAGLSDSLDSLMSDNGFIECLYGVFNIGSVPFKIDLGKVSYDKNGDLFLNPKQIKLLEDYLRRHISNVSVLEYAADIDISKIVTLEHIIVRDKNDKIYLITFTTLSYYAEGNEDVIKAMGGSL